MHIMLDELCICIYVYVYLYVYIYVYIYIYIYIYRAMLTLINSHNVIPSDQDTNKAACKDTYSYRAAPWWYKHKQGF